MPNEASCAGQFVAQKIKRLSESPNEALIKATLARLRRGVGKVPGSMPEIWEATMEGIPDALLSKGDAPTRGEWAVHTALTLFALHQQGKDLKQQPMCDGATSFGAAVRKLAALEPDHEETVKRRFNAVAMSDGIEMLSWRIRGMVQLLKANDIPLDYPALAKDLYWFQFSEGRDRVRLQWGLAFYHAQKKEETGSNAQ